MPTKEKVSKKQLDRLKRLIAIGLNNNIYISVSTHSYESKRVAIFAYGEKDVDIIVKAMPIFQSFKSVDHEGDTIINCYMNPDGSLTNQQ